MSPLLILGIGIVVVIGLIIVLRVHAFIALVIAAITVSLLAPGEFADKISRVAVAFGNTVGGIGIVIALAAIIGKCLMEKFREITSSPTATVFPLCKHLVFSTLPREKIR